MTGKNMKKRNSRELAKAAVQHGAFQKISEFRELLKILIKKKPQIIVEIGTARGGTFYSFCRVASPTATLISIDLPDGEFGGGYTEKEMKRISKYALKKQKTHFIRKDSHKSSTKDELKKILNGQLVDFLMIDGDHTYEGVKQDFDLYSDIVKEGGVIAFHDILFHPKVPDCQVDKFWNEIKDEYNSVEFIQRGDDRGWGEWGGIGIIYK